MATPPTENKGHPFKAKPCHCPEPVGDLRVGTCILCGHQVPGYEIPRTHVPFALGDRSTAARKRTLR